MDKAHILMHLEINIQVNGKKEKNQEEVLCIILLVQNMMVNGCM